MRPGFLEELSAYRAAPMDERCRLIREHYARMKARRLADYERKHGPGSAARDRAAALARPMPDSLSVALPRPWDRAGFWEYGR